MLPPMAISWTWRGERPRFVCPYFASSAAVKCPLFSTSPSFRSPSCWEETSAVLDVLVVGAISGSTPMIAAQRSLMYIAVESVEEELRRWRMYVDPLSLYTKPITGKVTVKLRQGQSARCVSMTCNLWLGKLSAPATSMEVCQVIPQQ